MSSTLSKVEETRELIESRIDSKATSGLSVSSQLGGVAFQSMTDVMEFSKLMSVSGQAVPPHCRNQPGICLGITIQAVEWRMSPYAVANKSYVVNDRLSYESQLIHAVIEQRAPIVGRLRHDYTGEGNTRRCKVWAYIRGEEAPLEYLSPEFKDINPKNSPLWKTKPDLQLFYNSSRDWARMFFPDVILGVYAEDEFAAETVDSASVSSVSTLDALADRFVESEPETSAATDPPNSSPPEAAKEPTAPPAQAETPEPEPARPAASSYEEQAKAIKNQAELDQLKERMTNDESMNVDEFERVMGIANETLQATWK